MDDSSTGATRCRLYESRWDVLEIQKWRELSLALRTPAEWMRQRKINSSNNVASALACGAEDRVLSRGGADWQLD